MVTRTQSAASLCLLGIFVFSGCAHQRLKFNTTHQAETVNDIYQRQVLDNLALFVENPDAIPHFSVIEGGTSAASDTASVNTGSLNSFRRVVGLAGNVSTNETWAFLPITTPDRLRLMRCAYQRAIGYGCNGCEDCCKLDREFRGATGTKFIKIQDRNGQLGLDPWTGLPFMVNDAMAINPRTGLPYVANSRGCVEIPKLDCNGPCTLASNWFCVGCKKDVPKECKRYSGNFGNTWVWVTATGREQLAKLTFLNLEYATGKKASAPGATKKITFMVDAKGKPVIASKAVGTVEATVKIGADYETFLKVEGNPCAPKASVATTTATVDQQRDIAGIAKEWLDAMNNDELPNFDSKSNKYSRQFDDLGVKFNTVDIEDPESLKRFLKKAKDSPESIPVTLPFEPGIGNLTETDRRSLFQPTLQFDQPGSETGRLLRELNRLDTIGGDR